MNMKAVLYYKPGVVKYEETNLPEIKPKEVLIKIETALTCGTDIKTYKRKIPIVNVIQKEAVVKVQVNVRVVSVKTSKVLFSSIGKAETRKKLTQGVLGLSVDNSKLLDNAMVNDTIQIA